MQKSRTTYAALLTAVITLMLPAAGFGQVVIGDWDSMTDEGWYDWGNGLSITNAANTNKYSFEPSFGTPSTAVQIEYTGWNQSLGLSLGTQGLIGAFMTNNQLRFEFSVPAGLGGGYSGVELIINADGYGYNQQYDFVVEGDPDNGNANGPQYYFWNGSPQRTAVVTYNYQDALNAIQSAFGTNDPGYVEIMFQINTVLDAQPEIIQINDVTLLQGLPPLIPAEALPRLVTPDATPTMEAFFEDGTETVNSNAVTVTVDGADVSSNAVYSYSASNATTTISYTPTTPYENGSTHTAQVVVASTPGGTLFTNEWSFVVHLLDTITYIDASDATIVMAPTNDGPVGAGVPLVTSTSNAVDGIWRARTGFGLPAGTSSVPVGVNTIATGGTGTIMESADFFIIDNTPRLKVSVSGLPNKGYNVYVYYWSDEGNSPWGIRAGFEDTPGIDSLPLVTNGVLIATDDSALQDGRILYQALLGIVTGTSIDVFIEDLPATENNRTWFDGIGYEPTGGAVLNPNITDYSLAGGTATLTWESELGAFYSILHKTNLTEASWTAVKTDIVSGGTNTSDSVSVSGADHEFFKVEGY